MKPKDVTFIQLHLEKFIIGLCVLIFLVVCYFWVMGNPHQIQMSGRALGPSEVEPYVLNQAETVRNRMQERRVPFERGQAPAYTDELQRRMAGSPATLAVLPVPLGQPFLDLTTAASQIDQSDPYHIPSPPVPALTVARADFGLLAEEAIGDEERRQAHRQVIERIGNPRPLDFGYVSVTGTFDFEEWRRRLNEEPPANMRRIPVNWANAAQVLTSVLLIRQEWDPARESWGAPTLIEPLPGQLAFTPDNANGIDRSDREAALLSQTLQDRWNPEIAQPIFPDMAAGWFWIPPDAVRKELTAEEQQQLNRINAEIATLNERIRRVREGGAAAAPGRAGTRPRGGGPAGGLDDGGGFGGMEDLAGLYRQLDNLTETRENILGIQRSDTGATREDLFDGPGGTRRQVNQIKIWAHDLTVQPGRVYRYKIFATPMNPLFHVGLVPEDQKAETYEQLALMPSERELARVNWSQPITTEPEFYYFLMAANANAQFSNWEVWRRFDGRLQNREFRAQPGDTIGSVEVVEDRAGNQLQLDMRVGAYVVDVAQSPVGRDTPQVLILDPLSNRLIAHEAESDRNAPRRQELMAVSTRQRAMGN